MMYLRSHRGLARTGEQRMTTPGLKRDEGGREALRLLGPQDDPEGVAKALALPLLTPEAAARIANLIRLALEEAPAARAAGKRDHEPWTPGEYSKQAST